MAQQIAVNVSVPSTTNFTGSAPQQRQFMLNTTNNQYVRYWTLTQDCLTYVYYTSSVVFPLYTTNGLAAAAYSALAQLTYAPVITLQPASTSSNHPGTASFYCSCSSEITPSYQWYSASFGSSIYGALSNNAGPSFYTGVTTNALSHSFLTNADSGSTFYCNVMNAAGTSSTNIVTLNVS